MANEMPYTPVRRVVTGHDDNVAIAVMDGQARNTIFPAPGTASTTLWSTDQMPADIAVGKNIEDYAERKLSIPPAINGTRFAIIEFAPGNGAFMHRTETVDYVVVISGEIDMDMDNSSVKLKAGDVVVQRGTNHAWANRGTVPARIAVVLVDAKPLGIGKAVPRA